MSLNQTNRRSATSAALWFAVLGGVALPGALWAIMAQGMSVLGPEKGLAVSVWAEHLLTMFWPTSILLISPTLGTGGIAILLALNFLVYGIIGHWSTKLLSHPRAYYALMLALLLVMLLSNGSFIWIAIAESPIPLSVIHVPSFLIAAAFVVGVFLLRMHGSRTASGVQSR